MNIRKNYRHYLMLLPFFAIFTLFFIWPMASGLTTSFFKWDGIHKMEYVQLDNYAKMFSDKTLLTSYKNLTIFTACTLGFGIPFSLIIAIIASGLNKRLNYVLRSLYFIPCMMPLFLSTLIWRWMLTPEYGIVNVFLKAIGLESVAWVSTPGYAIASVIFVDAWRASGFNILIFMTALKDIPTELYEAAEVDGVTTLQKIWHITIPLLEPVIFLLLINGIIGALQVFDIPWLMSQSFYHQYGGVGNGLLYPVMKIVGLAFGSQKFGLASAYSMLLFVITLVFSGLVFALRKKNQ